MKGIAAEASKKLPIDFFWKISRKLFEVISKNSELEVISKKLVAEFQMTCRSLRFRSFFFLNQCCLYFRRLFNNEWHLYRNSQSNNRRNSWKNLEFLKKFAKLIPELFPMALLKEFPVELLKNFKENFPKEFHKIPIISFQDFPIPSEIAKKFKKKFLKKTKKLPVKI